jgi:hypothetical protein
MQDDSVQPGTVCLTMTREQMLDVRCKADTRDHPSSLYRGQRIIGCNEYHSGSLGGEHGR